MVAELEREAFRSANSTNSSARGGVDPQPRRTLLVAARANLLSGQVQGHRDGFGFLIRDDGGPGPRAAPSTRWQGAARRPCARALSPVQDRRGRPEGEIVEVIERRTNKLVGRLLNERGVTMVVAPEDQRIAHDILVPPGARLSRARAGGRRRVVQQPQRYVQPVGRVIEVLGAIDDPGMEIEIAVRKFDVPHEFSGRRSSRTAEALPDTVSAEGPRRTRRSARRAAGHDRRRGRARLRRRGVLRAVLQGGRRKGWRLIVAIADVSHYVQPGDALDSDAQRRATSVYFPRRVIPMLPEKLSNGLCSLKPEVDRLVMVCDMVIDGKGARRRPTSSIRP